LFDADDAELATVKQALSYFFQVNIPSIVDLYEILSMVVNCVLTAEKLKVNLGAPFILLLFFPFFWVDYCKHQIVIFWDCKGSDTFRHKIEIFDCV
jgi:hypothetical protein